MVRQVVASRKSGSLSPPPPSLPLLQPLNQNGIEGERGRQICDCDCDCTCADNFFFFYKRELCEVGKICGIVQYMVSVERSPRTNSVIWTLGGNNDE